MSTFIKQFERFGQGSVKAHEQKALTKEKQVILIIRVKVFKSALKKIGPFTKSLTSPSAEERVGRNAVHPVATIEQLASCISSAASNVQNGLDTFWNVRQQEGSVLRLCLAEILKLDR